MAQKIVLVDDLDGTDAAEHIEFAFEGTSYAIDLSEKNAAAMRKALEKFIAAAEVTTPAPRRRRTSPKAATAKATDLDAVRAWARANGYDVADRGRIAQSVREAYDAAN